VAELTPFSIGADDLRRQAAEARRDAELTEKSFDELSERVWQD
jgi:hypothetical protein